MYHYSASRESDVANVKSTKREQQNRNNYAFVHYVRSGFVKF